MNDGSASGPGSHALPELETSRTRLRALTLDDAPALFRIFSDPEAMRYYDVEPHQHPGQAEDLVHFFEKRRVDGVGCRWGIELKPSWPSGAPRPESSLVGTIGFNRLERTGARRGVLGYDLVRSMWGLGLATEALRAVVDHGFDGLGLNRIEAYTEPENSASQRVLEKAGFTREGCLREFAFYRGSARDQICFAILARDRRPVPKNAGGS